MVFMSRFKGAARRAIALLKKYLKNRSTLAAFVGGLIGFVTFALIFPLSTVDPTNIGWLANSQGDMNLHYLGWEYFRYSPWSFPNIGAIPDLIYPNGVSVVYLDALPGMAIFFKIFNSILPVGFQYLGMFTLLSYILVGAIAGLIINLFTKRLLFVGLGSILFTTSSILISRSFAHTSLTAHWIVLLALYLVILFYKRKVSIKAQTVLWSILMVIATLTHAYFIPMVGSAFLISTIWQYKNIKTLAWQFLTPIASSILVFWLIGGLSSGTNGVGGGLGMYSSNVLALFIPQGYSNFFESVFLSPQWEGLAYLGLGTIVLLLIALFMYISRIQRVKFRDYVRSLLQSLKRPKVILSIVVVLGVFVLATGPSITFGDKVLFTIPLPNLIESVWNIFRSNGRLLWPIYYSVIVLGLAYVLIKTTKWKTWVLASLLVFVVVIQVTDVMTSDAVTKKRQDVQAINETSHVVNNLNAAFIDSYCDVGTVILLDGSPEAGFALSTSLSDFIVTCRPAITNSYLARFPESIPQYAQTQRTAISSGTANTTDTIYLTRDVDFVAHYIPSKYSVTELGGYWIIQDAAR